MFPGFQEKYYHAIAPGRNSIKKGKGVRYSITFCRILPQPSHLTKINGNEAVTEDEEEVDEEEDEGTKTLYGEYCISSITNL